MFGMVQAPRQIVKANRWIDGMILSVKLQTALS
jgi:hypothetical protein